LKSEQNIDAQN